jgi:hypothetical protein
MNSDVTNQSIPYRLTEEAVAEELQQQPHLFMRLAENALAVAESLRGNYFKNTATFITDLRRAIQAAATGKRTNPVLTTHQVSDANWMQVQGEVVTFVDGGVGQVQLSSQVPILLRVGSYCVRTGERQLAEREQFGYYPVILGDLEGGNKERKDFIDIVRITAELLGGLAALDRNPDLNALMFHGPLVYLVGSYAGHTPFTEKDIDIFLQQYATNPEKGREIKRGFLTQAKLDIYPRMTDNSDEWVRRGVFEPLAFMSYLLRRLIAEAKQRKQVPIIAGAVERGGRLREFVEGTLLERVFRGLRAKNREDYFNQMYGRVDLASPKSLLDRLGYTDALLLAMLLEPGEYSESWTIKKYESLHKGRLSLPGSATREEVDFTALRPSHIGFPQVRGCYVMVSKTTEPVRVEVFDELGEAQVTEAARRVYLYSKLLPGYGFPVGLDIADKFAHVPNWLTEAYAKIIRHHLGISLQSGEISDLEMRRILVQAIYMTHRDWLFRPKN